MPEQTIEDLGRSVREKYPEDYRDLSDRDLGALVKQKYPADYGDFADIEERGPLGQAWDFAKEVFRTPAIPLSKITEPLMERGGTIPMGTASPFAMSASPRAAAATIKDVPVGAAHGLMRSAEQLTSPQGLLTMWALGGLPKLGFPGFTTALGIGGLTGYEAVKHFADSLGIQDVNEMSAMQTEALVEGLMAFGILKHTLKPRAGKVQFQDIVDAVSERPPGMRAAKAETGITPETQRIAPTPERAVESLLPERTGQPFTLGPEAQRLAAEADARLYGRPSEPARRAPEWREPARNREFDEFGQVEPEVAPMVRNAVDARIAEITNMFESGLGELSRKGRTIERVEEIPYEAMQHFETGFGSIPLKSAFPELASIKGSPAEILRAIRAGESSPKYREIRREIARKVFEDYEADIADENMRAMMRREAPTEAEWAERMNREFDAARPETWVDEPFLTGEEGFADILPFRRKGDKAYDRMISDIFRTKSEIDDLIKLSDVRREDARARRTRERFEIVPKRGEEGFADIGEYFERSRGGVINPGGELTLLPPRTSHFGRGAPRNSIMFRKYGDMVEATIQGKPDSSQMARLKEMVDEAGDNFEFSILGSGGESVGTGQGWRGFIHQLGKLKGEEGFARMKKEDQKGFEFKPMQVEGQTKEQGMKDLMKQTIEAPEGAVSKRELLNLNKKKKKKANSTPLFEEKGLFE